MLGSTFYQFQFNSCSSPVEFQLFPEFTEIELDFIWTFTGVDQNETLIDLELRLFKVSQPDRKV